MPMLLTYRLLRRKTLSRRLLIFTAASASVAAVIILFSLSFRSFRSPPHLPTAAYVPSSEAMIREAIASGDGSFLNTNYADAELDYNRALNFIAAVELDYPEDRDRYRVLRSEVEVKLDLARIGRLNGSIAKQ